ncbi:MAG TPA: GDP-L-fucose synthase [Oligoflexia bacterium]|nr:GDP-L-fucose synthase [Oligoflexia bacterium]HMP27442.1 GDP-L-fucose synthase [Oligoflexia bacterium]
MDTGSRIFIAGHRGLVGSAIVRALNQRGFKNLILKPRSELDLLDQRAVNNFFQSERPEYVFLAAAKVGGILHNNLYQADFLYENLMTAANVIKAAADGGVKKLLFLGSSCIYPRAASQPINESALLTGPLEPTNEGYALAKIAGLKLCEKYFTQYGKMFISAMPTNTYGEGDNFHPEHSHVIPGMMRRFHDAKVKKLPQVVVWGSGKPRREFLYVDDLAAACLLLMERYQESATINVGTGEDCEILELARIIKEVVGFDGELVFDSSKPDGMPRKVLDVSRIKKLGWAPKVSLFDGLKKTYEWALANSKL